jgi:hypothetical protein
VEGQVQRKRRYDCLLSRIPICKFIQLTDSAALGLSSLGRATTNRTISQGCDKMNANRHKIAERFYNFALLSIPPKEHLSTNSSATLARKKTVEDSCAVISSVSFTKQFNWS